MTEPKPLKDKIFETPLSVEDAYWESQGGGEASRIKVVNIDAVKAAVEYLKDKMLHYGMTTNKDQNDAIRLRLLEYINESFPDIVSDPAPKRVPITKCGICGSDFENNDEDECDICGKRICHNCSIWNESRNRTICFECSEKTGDNNEDEQN
jgi:hypothetical protein